MTAWSCPDHSQNNMQNWCSSLNGALKFKRGEKNSVFPSHMATVNIKAKRPKVTGGDPVAQVVLGAK